MSPLPQGREPRQRKGERDRAGRDGGAKKKDRIRARLTDHGGGGDDTHAVVVAPWRNRNQRERESYVQLVEEEDNNRV